MPLNRNQKILLFCPRCGEDVGKTIQWLYDNTDVYCNSYKHDLSEQASKVVSGLREADKLLEMDLARIKEGN
jgi:hypothetical protein